MSDGLNDSRVLVHEGRRLCLSVLREDWLSDARTKIRRE
ncbi:hypothetical protein AKJ09_02115 [Labilithrix luteola]|uniref:Uncharacterized protein n=1 Tax=Labilithrix luteola TaxID=1391654 RepID=A0A0K1PPZ3_9BACT|nr:hypothetical protein AKJ09_02115 [Labilithrix luteola]